MQNTQTRKPLRDDQVSQRAAQGNLEGAKKAWLTGTCAQMLDDLALYGAGEGFANCPALSNAFQSLGFALDIISDLIGNMCGAISDHPLGQVPFRHQYQHGIGVLQLAARGNTALSLVLYEERDLIPPPTTCFTDSECREIVLAGGGSARILELEHERGEAKINQSDIAMKTGIALHIDGFSTAKQLTTIDETMVILRLSRTAVNPRQSCEYRLSDGQLLHRASGDRKDSRHEMFVAVLGAMGRKDAAPVLSDLAEQGGDQLRWQALRNCLALDSEAGFHSLSMIADNPNDTLSVAAKALRAQLLSAHPQLAKLEIDLCPV